MTSGQTHSGANLFDPAKGFLPSSDPLRRLPPDFDSWEEISLNLPKYLVSDRIREIILRLPKFPLEKILSQAELERAMVLLSYLGHAYVWGEKSAPSSIPESLAIPWYQVAKRLGRPPVLSYSSYALHNWYRFDSQAPVALGNIALIQNFLGGIDEEWFILIHVDIEAKSASAIASLQPAKAAAEQGDTGKLLTHLQKIASVLSQMNTSLKRMPEHCDPYIYYNRVRPYIFGWKNNPALPNGLLYEGVSEYSGKPQQFRGETGSQSSIIPALDAALGISQKKDVFSDYLLEMRDYMPPNHRAFIESFEASPSIRDIIVNKHRSEKHLCEAFNTCISEINEFRTTHLNYAAEYIQKQSEKNKGNPTEIGTGGTPFMAYLKKHQVSTEEHLIR